MRACMRVCVCVEMTTKDVLIRGVALYLLLQLLFLIFLLLAYCQPPAFVSSQPTVIAIHCGQRTDNSWRSVTYVPVSRGCTLD